MAKDDNNLYIYSTNRYFTTLSHQLQISQTTTCGEYIENEKPPMNSLMHVNLMYSYLSLIPNKNDCDAISGYYVELTKIDSNLESFPYFGRYKSSCIGLNEKNELLIPYRAKNDNKLHLLFMAINPSNQFSCLDTFYTRKITIESPTDTFGSKFSQYAILSTSYVDGYFYVGVQFNNWAWATYRISTDGSYQKIINYSAAVVFKHQNHLFAVCDKNIYVSSDNGLSWPLAYNFGLSMSFYYFFNVDGDLFASLSDQLYQVFITPNSFTLQQLSNEGLDGLYITTVTTFNNFVVVGGINGIYFIDKVNFRKPKKVE